MLLHAREGHVELLGKLRDRSIRTSELLQNAAPSGVRERGERGIEAGCDILNHMVQCLNRGLAACKGRPVLSSLVGRLSRASAEGSCGSLARRGSRVTAEARLGCTIRPRGSDAEGPETILGGGGQV